MGYISDEKKEEILDNTDIVALINEYVPLKRQGANYMGLCPFHSEKTPSFSVNPKGQYFHCFGCHKGGDALTFLMEYQNINFNEAITQLAERSGIELKTEKVSKLTLKINRLLDINYKVMMHFYKNLLTSSYAVNYLKKRNIRPKLVNNFILGYAKNTGEDIINLAKENNWLLSDLLELGLVKKRYNNQYIDAFRNRLIFPIIDSRNKVIGFGGRSPDNTMPKYLNSPESIVFEKRNNLYAINNFKKSRNKEIILVEGYMDVISLFNYDITNAIASLGTSFTKSQALLIKRYTKDVYISYDGDSAGKNATRKAIDTLLSVGINPKIIEIESGLDPDDYIKKNGKESFLALKNVAKDSYDYQFDDLINRYNRAKDNEKNSLIDLFIDFLAKIHSINSLLTSKYINYTCKLTKVSEEELYHSIKNRKKVNRLNRSEIIERKPTEIFYDINDLNLQVDILNILINNLDFYNQHEEYFEEFIIDERIKKIKDYIKLENDVNISKLEDEFYDEKYYPIISHLKKVDVLADELLLKINEAIKKRKKVLQYKSKKQ